MKRLAVIFLAGLMCFTFACCGGEKTPTDAPDQGGNSKNKAMITVNEGEMILIATVKEVNGNSLLLADEKGSEYVFNYSDEVTVVEDDYYVLDLSADYFAGKNVTVIVSDQVQETWPMGLTGERMIIIE